jgi:hypothetical protein
MIATPTTDELVTNTATAPHRMCAAPDRQFGCSCEPWSCIRHASTRTPSLEWPHVASSRIVEYRTETNISAGTKAGTGTAAAVIGLATSTSNSAYAPKLIPAVIPTETLDTYVTMIPTPATELALGSAAPAPSPATATVAYCTRGFYNEQYSAVCNTACGSTSEQAATPVTMPAISPTVNSSGAGASWYDYEQWKQPVQHLDKRKAHAFLTTTRRPMSKGGSTGTTTYDSIKRGELSGSTSPTTTLMADAKGRTERGLHAQSMGENGMDSSACTYSTASDVATSWNATDCAYNGDDTELDSCNDRGASHGDYCDTTSVSADPCFANPATINSISFRTISCNNSSSPLISTHWRPLLQTKVDQNPPPSRKGGSIPERLHGAPSSKGGSSKHLHESRSLRGTLSAKQITRSTPSDGTVSMEIGALTVSSPRGSDQVIYYTWCSSTEVEENENNGDGTSPCGSTTGGPALQSPR